MDDIALKENKYHAISFESSKVQQQFRQLLKGYFTNKNKKENEFLQIVDENNNEINSKDFHFINFNCNTISLTAEKHTDKLIRETLLYHFENHPNYIEEYNIFHQKMDKYINSIELSNNDLQIEFTSTNKTTQNFIKSLDINIEHNDNEFVPNYLLRNYLIQLLIKMNVMEKRIFMLISFPESDVGHEDFLTVTHLLKEFKVTTLVITTQQDFLTAAGLGQMFLVKKYGIIYNVNSLKEELEAFNVFSKKEAVKMAKAISFKDFVGNLQLLNDDLRRFLVSNKF